MSSTAVLPVVAPPPLTSRSYGALVSMMLMSFLLVTAEFLPNGVLTEMADELGVTVGQAGQTITVTAFVGLLVAPTVGMVFPRWDRRSLLVYTAVAAGVSNLAVAVAPNLALLLLSRVLLGAAISTFWAMSITVAAAIAGVGGLVGNVIVGAVIDRTFVLFGVVAPLAIGAAIVAMLMLPGSVI